MTTKILVGSLAAMLVGGAAAHATTVDLMTSSSGTLNGAIFSLADNQPTGSGVYDPFLTIQNKVTEQGYNASIGNFDTKREPVYNHEIQLSQLNATTINGVQYYSFNVDVNEINSATGATISLDALRIWTSPTTQYSLSTDKNGLFNGSLGTLRYDSGAGNNVFLKDVNSGSGQSDLAFFIPVSAFAGAAGTDNVYIYQYWGKEFNTDGGYEETTIGAGTTFTSVPEPSTLLPLMGLFGALGGMQRWRRNSAATVAE